MGRQAGGQVGTAGKQVGGQTGKQVGRQASRQLPFNSHACMGIHCRHKQQLKKASCTYFDKLMALVARYCSYIGLA